jgi:hypothetical protein
MWFLILIAVHVNNPNDIPGRVSMQFATQEECERARSTVSSWLKFSNFKVVSECKKQS